MSAPSQPSRDDLIAALQTIAEMSGKTLIYDPSEDFAVRQAYSLGANRAFEQAAAVARTVLPPSQPNELP